jgi:hypothetical protein
MDLDKELAMKQLDMATLFHGLGVVPLATEATGALLGEDVSENSHLGKIGQVLGEPAGDMQNSHLGKMGNDLLLDYPALHADESKLDATKQYVIRADTGELVPVNARALKVPSMHWDEGLTG